MNCNDFQQRMQQRIDDRMLLTDDEELNVHAMLCGSCCEQLETWQQIESVLELKQTDVVHQVTAASTDPRSKQRLGLSIVAAAAVALLIVSFMPPRGHQNNVTRVALAPATTAGHQQVDPALWWQRVQQRDWIGQTMPAVKSVRDGVAPLGRSLIQAVAILTTTGSEQTS